MKKVCLFSLICLVSTNVFASTSQPAKNYSSCLHSVAQEIQSNFKKVGCSALNEVNLETSVQACNDRLAQETGSAAATGRLTKTMMPYLTNLLDEKDSDCAFDLGSTDADLSDETL